MFDYLLTYSEHTAYTYVRFRVIATIIYCHSVHLCDLCATTNDLRYGIDESDMEFIYIQNGFRFHNEFLCAQTNAPRD